MKFLKWMSSPEQQVRWHKSTGYFPIRKSAIEMLEAEGWFKENPNFRVALIKSSRHSQALAPRAPSSAVSKRSGTSSRKHSRWLWAALL